MNLIPLLAALVPWAGTPLSAFTRIYVACCVLSLEMQTVTWTGVGSLRALVPINLAVAVGSVGWHVVRGRKAWGWVPPVLRVAPWPAVAALAVLVAGLNAGLPVEAADPYQLDRVALIERLGTLGYDLAANPKVNIAGAFYELMVADLRQLGFAGSQLVRLHGLVGLGLYFVTLAAILPWFPGRPSSWGRVLLLVVPAVFHQLVLLKNDLFLAAPALVALAWLVTREPEDWSRMRWTDVAWAAWLVGMVVGSKQVHAPLAVVLVVGIWISAARWPLAQTVAAAAGGAAGGVCAGLVLTFAQNAAAYGDPFATGPVVDMGNLNRSLGEAAVGTGRFLLSLFDMGRLTPVLWPGRGGWGGTLGLPLVWALAVLVPGAVRAAGPRRALAAGLAHLTLFACIFPDADLAHRLVLGPGLLLIVAAVHHAGRVAVGWHARTLVAAVLLSAAQILRSALLYTARP